MFWVIIFKERFGDSKSKVKVVAIAKNTERTDYYGHFQWSYQDIVWIGNPDLRAEQSWASITVAGRLAVS